MTYGTVYTKKANKWLFYISYNIENVQDTHEWYATEEEALKRLKEHEDGPTTKSV